MGDMPHETQPYLFTWENAVIQTCAFSKRNYQSDSPSLDQHQIYWDLLANASKDTEGFSDS